MLVPVPGPDPVVDPPGGGGGGGGGCCVPVFEPSVDPVPVPPVGGGGGGGCSGPDAHGAPCEYSQPGSGGGGSSLVPPGGTFALSDDFEPKVMITVVRYGWWGIP